MSVILFWVAADGPRHRISISTNIVHPVHIESFIHKIIDKVNISVFAIIKNEIRGMQASVAVAAFSIKLHSIQIIFSPATLQRCMTCDNPPVIPERKIQQTSSSVIVIGSDFIRQKFFN
ncbi:MAG: hypothetical protein EZS28_034416 [Streblomastix strix]|uniref:Uncharacterized protein n=1 Tax=Streblomastix strix TaxID=222440 RepID=A0A5J4UHZ3_9EUKA|nr:MAG: hypothetical protein EZS28_034416 [Streblomastix strix]